VGVSVTESDRVPGDGPAGGREPQIIPDPLRRPALVVVLIAAAMFLVLAVAVAGEDGSGRLDAAVAALTREYLAPFRGLFSLIQRLGAPTLVGVGCVTLALVCLALRRPWLAALAATGPVLTGLGTIVLKPVIGRTRSGDYAFPSGHAAGLCALVIVVAVIVISFAGARVYRVAVLAAIGALLAGTVIGFSVATRGGHYATDTVGSFCLAIIMVVGLALLIDAVRAGWARRPARPG
jgi:undecaprenyl-diphosphatase